MIFDPKPTYLALDITDIVLTSLAWPGMSVYTLYYPLKDIIEDLLKTDPSPGEMDIFYEKIDTLIPSTVEIDGFSLELFAERFYLDMDRIVSEAIGKKYDEYIYTMKGWLNSNSVLLEIKSYANNTNINTMHDFGIPF